MANTVIPPPYVITDTDKRGLIVLTVALILSFVWTCFLIRLWLRVRKTEWKSDDYFLAAATVLITIQSGIVLWLVNLGLGTSLQEWPLSHLERIGKGGLASQLLYIITLFFSKCSVLFLYLRISPGGIHRVATLSVMGASTLWVLLGIILVSVPCNPITHYRDPATCTNEWAKWQAIGALDIVTETMIFSLAVQLVWKLQMRFKTKVFVVGAFSARLPVIGAAAVRLWYLDEQLNGEIFTFEYIVATQWQLGYAIMSCTITGMGPFLRPFTRESTRSYKTSTGSVLGGSASRSKSLMPESIASPTVPAFERRRGSGVSGVSQSYLMQTLPSARASGSIHSVEQDKHVAEYPGPSRNSRHSHKSDSSSSVPSIAPTHYSPSSQAPIMLKADEEFQPSEGYKRHETDIWVGNRSVSSRHGGEEVHLAPVPAGKQRWTIGKKTEFKIEVDRASRCLPGQER